MPRSKKHRPLSVHVTITLWTTSLFDCYQYTIKPIRGQLFFNFSLLSENPKGKIHCGLAEILDELKGAEARFRCSLLPLFFNSLVEIAKKEPLDIFFLLLKIEADEATVSGFCKQYKQTLPESLSLVLINGEGNLSASNADPALNTGIAELLAA